MLDAYPAYHRVVQTEDRYGVTDKRQARQHRLNIGTIVSGEQVQVKFMRGKRLGFIDENYVAKLKVGDRFIFAGKPVELIKLRDLEAVVKPANAKSTNVPAWQGSFMSLSSSLGLELRELLGELADEAPVKEPEALAAAPIIDLQRRMSVVPLQDELLVETWQVRDGHHLFVHSFAGKAVNETLADLVALRLSRLAKTTFAVVANDYGFALISTNVLAWEELFTVDILSVANLAVDLAQTVDATQGAKRRFREIARIAGLVHQSYPGQRKTGRAVHASAALLFDTLNRFDPGNLLVEQAKQEAVRELYEGEALLHTLARLSHARWRWVVLKRPSPLAFPLVVERVRARLGSESIEERVQRMRTGWT